ncbi:hypothetical protein [Hungatella hathewayi]|uniref:hypothetical protein n=1 Tax=Hungatella hathewayi TaxID=154046 RepID=UPI0006C2D51D|nr:hypothetical protein [Hungatella hathewayi]CUP47482.1 Uncharacterised protein [Hungatella hathewayi]
MTKGYVKAVINKYDIERLKESVKVGDRLIYRTIFRDILNERVSIPVQEPVTVVRKFDNLVQVKYTEQPDTLPLKTMKYEEILFQRKGLDWNGERKTNEQRKCIAQ